MPLPDGLLAAFFQRAHAALLAEAASGGAAAEFLLRRGFAAEQFDGLPLGWVPANGALCEELLAAGFTAMEIGRSRLLADRRLTGRLVGPICDLAGRLHSVFARCVDDAAPAYLYKGRWKLALPVFGLDAAERAGPAWRDDLLLVDDVLDAVLMHAMGLRRVAAVGGSGTEMIAPRWRRLAELGARRVTLVFWRDPQRRAGALAALNEARAAGVELRLDVVPPERLAGFDGPAGAAPWHGELGAWLESQRMTAAAYRRWRLPRAEPQAAAAADDTAEPQAAAADTAKPQAAAPAAEATLPASNSRLATRDYCPLHRCRTTECFCFD